MVKGSQGEQKAMLATLRKCRQPLVRDLVTGGLVFLEEALIREHSEAPISSDPESHTNICHLLKTIPAGKYWPDPVIPEAGY